MFSGYQDSIYYLNELGEVYYFGNTNFNSNFTTKGAVSGSLIPYSNQMIKMPLSNIIDIYPHCMGCVFLASNGNIYDINYKEGAPCCGYPQLLPGVNDTIRLAVSYNQYDNTANPVYFALTNLGDVYSMGTGNCLGLGTSVLSTNSFTKIPGLSDIANIFVEPFGNSAFFLTRNGEVYVLGLTLVYQNNEYQLQNYYTPHKMKIADVVNIIPTNTATCFIKENGDVYVQTTFFLNNDYFNQGKTTDGIVRAKIGTAIFDWNDHTKSSISTLTTMDKKATKGWAGIQHIYLSTEDGLYIGRFGEFYDIDNGGNTQYAYSFQKKSDCIPSKGTFHWITDNYGSLFVSSNKMYTQRLNYNAEAYLSNQSVNDIAYTPNLIVFLTVNNNLYYTGALNGETVTTPVRLNLITREGYHYTNLRSEHEQLYYKLQEDLRDIMLNNEKTATYNTLNQSDTTQSNITDKLWLISRKELCGNDYTFYTNNVEDSNEQQYDYFKHDSDTIVSYKMSESFWLRTQANNQYMYINDNGIPDITPNRSEKSILPVFCIGE